MTPKEAKAAGYEVRRGRDGHWYEGFAEDSSRWYIDSIYGPNSRFWLGYRTRRDALDDLEMRLAEMPELDQRNRSCEGNRS